MFKQLEINEERDLENLVVKDPESIEKGLKYLAHQRQANGKFIDVLAVDADGILVIIELKIGQDDEMLLQALEYYDYVSSNRDRLAKEYEKRAKIVTVEDPRIILVASGFSERLKRAVRFFEPSTKLMEYAYLETKGGDKGLFCHEVSYESEDDYEPAISLEGVLSYVTDPKVKGVCEKVHAELLKLGKDIEDIPREGQVRYKCKNRVVGGLSVRRTFFYVWWFLDSDNWDEVKLANPKEWLSRKQKVTKGFIKRYHAVGGE
jgi:hypothetical protein